MQARRALLPQNSARRALQVTLAPGAAGFQGAAMRMDAGAKSTANARTPGDDWRAAALLTAAITLARLVAIFRTPLELYPDEAQYWIWSRTLDFGYYSKPPMVAWAIWATTRLGGDAEPWVRLSAPIFQAGAALAVFAIGRRLYGPTVGLAAVALYSLMPGVQLSATVAATDAPLLFFLGLTIAAYVALQTAQGSGRLAWAAAFGAALGLAFLSKYAAVYAVMGVALHLVISRPARQAWTPGTAILALLVFAGLLAPNLVWNATHGFETLQHTAANASWGGRKLFNLRELGQFLATQFGVFGPIPFAVLMGGAALMAWRRKLTSADLLLLCFSLPPLLIVSAQAFVSRANANWSGAGYLPGAVLAAAWLIRWRAQRWLTAAVGLQAALAALFLVVAISPAFADRLGLSNGFKRAKGWAATTDLVLKRAQSTGDYSAIAVNNRFLYYALAYYGRDFFARPGAPKLTGWLLTATPQNQAEASAPLTPALGRRVLAVSYEGWWRAEMMADFQTTYGDEIVSVGLDRKHQRRTEMFAGEDFRPVPRDPASGLPISDLAVSGPPRRP
jgi:4-amino-4-deoxy-L-arabinose transferase-like glycosyltransferase